jgi:MATE family multidrug resistance protein
MLFCRRMGNNGVDQERLLGLEAVEQSDFKQRIWVELKLMWRIAFPSILARVAAFGMIVVTQSFVGRAGELELAAFALVQSLILRFSNGILVGHYYMF